MWKCPRVKMSTDSPGVVPPASTAVRPTWFWCSRRSVPSVASTPGGPLAALVQAWGMNAERLPLFCDSALAERIERVEARLVATVGEAARGRGTDPAGFMILVAGGVASFAEEGSPFNKVAGLGFGGVPSAAAMDEIEL
jgi:hypothetical protein